MIVPSVAFRTVLNACASRRSEFRPGGLLSGCFPAPIPWLVAVRAGSSFLAVSLASSADNNGGGLMAVSALPARSV